MSGRGSRQNVAIPTRQTSLRGPTQFSNYFSIKGLSLGVGRGRGGSGYSMRRREFITLIGGAAAWPLDIRAQQASERRVAILWRGDASEGVVRAQQGALQEGLVKLGWIEGRNIRFELRYS